MPRCKREAGFTLIEILVALAILGLALGTIFVSFKTGATGMAAARQKSEAIAIANALLAAEGSAIPLAAGEISGTTADGFRWRVLTTPWGTASDNKARLVAAYEIDIAVTKDQRSEIFGSLLAAPVAHAP